MSAPSRLEHARRRLRVTRYVIGAVATAGFAAVGIAARSSHPATHHATKATTTSTSSAVTSSDDDSSTTFGFGDGSIGSSASGSAPSAQSGGS